MSLHFAHIHIKYIPRFLSVETHTNEHIGYILSYDILIHKHFKFKLRYSSDQFS